MSQMPKDLSSVIKNKEIFEKAQKRDNNVDWYSKMQDSKDAFFKVEKVPMRIG